MFSPKSVVVVALTLVIYTVGCEEKKHPGNWAAAEVQAKVKQSLNLSELTVTPDPAGGFQGTGKNAEGETFTIKITQDVAAKKLSWDSKGDRGSNEVGHFEFQ